MAGPDNRVRGMQEKHETHSSYMYRDSRSPITKFFDALRQPKVMTSLLVTMAAAAYLAPAIAHVLILVAIGFFVWGMRQVEQVPLKLPIQANPMIDPKTGSSAAGIFFIGNDRHSLKEIWLTNDDCRQHMLVLGTTGAGKTESLLGFVANALTWSSGFLFCDGKGDVALFAKVYALARQFGREDDILVLNFMTGNRDQSAMGGKLLSNTLNPFATGSSDSLTTMVVSLMEDSGGDGAMWKGRATAMFTGVMRALTWLRDQDIVDLNVGTIRDYLNLKMIIDLADPGKYEKMPPSIRKSVRSYLTSLPGFQEEKGYKQAQTTLDQHGYLEMQFTKILGSLADVYGYIFSTPAGDVDVYDVVLQRRILVIMLPALEKDPGEIANLGKIVVANLKGMMGATLGNSIQGNWQQVVDNRVTNSPSPFLVLLDEVGYYTVEGMALMTAQARSLGFGLILASQDIPAMKKLNEKEAQSIIANTNTKIFMRAEEPEQTIGLAVQSAGKAYRTQVSGFSGQSGEMSLNYRDNLDASIQEVDRVNARDVRSQQPGEMIVLHQDYMIYAKSFYANPEGQLQKKGLNLSTNHFIRVPKPSKSEIEADQRVPEVLERLLDDEFAREMVDRSKQALKNLPAAAAGQDMIALTATGFESYRTANPHARPEQAACAAVANAVRAMGGLGDMLGQAMAERNPAGSGPSSFLYDDDDPIAPPSRRPPQDYMGDEDEDDDILAPDDMDALNALMDEPARPDQQHGDAPQPSQRQKAAPPKATVLPVEHGVNVDGKDVDDVSQYPHGNDAVYRLYADLDYNPEKTSKEEVAQRIDEDLGARYDPNFEDVAESEQIDAVVHRTESIRESQPAPEQSSQTFLSDFLDSLMEDQEGD